MPGSPDPVLGSLAVTAGVSVVVATLVASLPVVFRKDLPTPRRLAFGGGLGYALLSIGAWVGARIATDAFVVSPFEQPLAFVGLLAVGLVALGVQAAILLYLYARWGLAMPIVGLFATTAIALYAFLLVRGETDPLALYGLFFGPLSIGLVVVASVLELGCRWVLARRG